MKGFLQPGQWHYYEMTLDPTESSWMVRPERHYLLLPR